MGFIQDERSHERREGRGRERAHNVLMRFMTAFVQMIPIYSSTSNLSVFVNASSKGFFDS